MTNWTTDGWQSQVRHAHNLRLTLPKTARRSFSLWMLAAIFGLIASSQAPGTDDYGDPTGSRVVEVGLYAIAILFVLLAFRTLIRYIGDARRTTVVHQWFEDAGPKVIVTVIDGGPRVGRDLPVDSGGLGLAAGAFSPPVIGGAHPLLAVGALAISGLVNGVAYLKNKPDLDRQQAALTAEYRAYSRERLALMMERYERSAKSPRSRELVQLTALAVNSIPKDRPRPASSAP